MNTMAAFIQFIFQFFISLCLINANAKANPFPVIVVDKAKHQLHMAVYQSDKINFIKSYHVTLGKVVGDKEVEKDFKTPEGVYFFRAKLTPPTLKKKFGVMALMMDYPNVIDRSAGKTGYDIMLHATDDPARLKKDYDSEGCVVIDNSEIEEVSKSIRLGLTPILIYPELKPEYLSADYRPEVKQAFDRWLTAWKTKDINAYIGSYGDGFSYNGMNLKKYREYKNSLNQKYDKIQIDVSNIRYFFHPKYDVVSFTQRYQSTLKNGRKGFDSTGTKMLYFQKTGEQYRIAAEDHTTMRE